MSCARTILQLKHLTRSARINGHTKNIVDDFTFDFETGQIYSILGPSGSGKSSLLRLINRLDEAYSGEVIFKDKSWLEYDPCHLRRKIGYLFQTAYLFDGTVRDNIIHGCGLLDDNRIVELVEHVQFDPKLLDSVVDNLSIGEKQRVALARLLANQPEVILLDEPTSALDPTRTEAIERLIKTIVEEDCLIALLVTHDPQQALRMGGTTLLMVEGRLVEHGPSEQIVTNPRSDQGRLYMDKKLT